MASNDAQQTLHVNGIRAAFQAMKENEAKISTLEMIYNEIVIVWGAHHFAAHRHSAARPRQPSPDCLCVWSANPPGGSECHPERSEGSPACLRRGFLAVCAARNDTIHAQKESAWRSCRRIRRSSTTRARGS